MRIEDQLETIAMVTEAGLGEEEGALGEEGLEAGGSEGEDGGEEEWSPCLVRLARRFGRTSSPFCERLAKCACTRTSAVPCGVQ